MVTLVFRTSKALAAVDDEHHPAAGNPIDRALDVVRPKAARKVLLLLFNAPIAVTLGTIVVLAAPEGSPIATSVLGIATAGVAMLALITAVLRTLALGSAADRTSEIDLSGTPPFRNWAGVGNRHSPEARTVNVFTYFFVLLYMSALGFGALYCSIDLAPGSAFSAGDVEVGRLSWLYFSITTLATVGFGDVHARSAGAQVAAACQIVSGPLIVGWFLAALPGRPAEAAAIARLEDPQPAGNDPLAATPPLEAPRLPSDDGSLAFPGTAVGAPTGAYCSARAPVTSTDAPLPASSDVSVSADASGVDSSATAVPLDDSA